MEKNIIGELWSEIENKKEKSKMAEKIYNWLNKDNLSSIIVNDNVFYFEKTSSLSSFPNYIYKWLVKWGEKRGLTYLYNLK